VDFEVGHRKERVTGGPDGYFLALHCLPKADDHVVTILTRVINGRRYPVCIGQAITVPHEARATTARLSADHILESIATYHSMYPSA